ncbi:hypothetical protein G20c_108 [Thermus phage G20c]|nr:hypothetical protein G20c_108 [Thermus phage G20c]
MSRIRGWQIKPGDLALEHLNQEARAYLDGLAASLQTLSQQAGGLTEEIISLQNELAQVNTELEEAAQNIQAVQQRLGALVTETEASLSTLNTRLSDLDADLTSVREELSALRDGTSASLGALTDSLAQTQATLDVAFSNLNTALEELGALQSAHASLAQTVTELSDRVLALERRPSSQASLSLVELSGTTEISEPTLVMVLEARLQSAGALKVYADNELIAEYNDVAGTYRFNPVGEGLATATIRVEGPGTALVSLVPLGV